MSILDDAITRCMEKAIAEHMLPGGVVGYIKGNATHTLAFGKVTYRQDASAVTTDTLYDLASVTKAIPTASLILMLAEQGKLTLEDPVIKYIPELTTPGREKIRIRHLLSFTAVFDLPQPLSMYAREGGEAVLKRVLTSPLRHPPGNDVLYADIPYLLLGMIIERVTHNPLDTFAEAALFQPLNMTYTTFHPLRFKGVSIAPTEIRQGKEIVGEAHDEKARALRTLGMSTGHAGLFSAAKDLLTYCHVLLNGGTWAGKRYFTHRSLTAMRDEVAGDSSLGFSLGWTTRATYLGTGLPRDIFCKSGFTGTLVVVSPSAQCSLVVLTNRTYPKRPDSPAAINSVRHELVHIIFS